MKTQVRLDGRIVEDLINQAKIRSIKAGRNITVSDLITGYMKKGGYEVPESGPGKTRLQIMVGGKKTFITVDGYKEMGEEEEGDTGLDLG